VKTISWILLVSFIIYSCSPTYTIRHNQSDYLELNEELEGKQTTITLVNNVVILGENVSVRLDSTSWLELASYNDETKTTRTVPTWVIRHIEIKSFLYGFKT